MRARRRGAIRSHVRDGRNRMSDALSRLDDLTDEILRPGERVDDGSGGMTKSRLSLQKRMIPVQFIRPELLTADVLLQETFGIGTGNPLSVRMD